MSENNGPATTGPDVTVTGATLIAVAPRSSVTVNVTEYVPTSAYACDAVTPEPVDWSPKSHAYDTTEPSASDDPEPSTDTDNPDTDDTNPATGT
ncbi:hypothetical protein AS96_14780 [Microbacterium sp. MRS-1]|nr:hypothetical protein AS96_14780 [Microbacterium sp. MRS-1]